MKSGRRYSLIVFDWDGTLYDSASLIAECIQMAARDMALPVPDRRMAPGEREMPRRSRGRNQAFS